MTSPDDERLAALDWRVLLASLIHFGKSQDGSVERDLRNSIEDICRRLDARLRVEPTSADVETLSAEIHTLYCRQYEAEHGMPYWSMGDYAKLDERTKEYDRNIARFIIARCESAAREARERAIAECAPHRYEAWTREEIRTGNLIASRIRDLADKLGEP